jgi:putative two-component system response regulator
MSATTQSNTPPPPNDIKGAVVIVTSATDGDSSIVKDLQAKGYEVVVCTQPSRAILLRETKNRDWKPGLFLIDVVLPEIGGFELVRRIAEKYGDSRARIFMMSPYKSQEDELEAYNAGASALLFRPLTSADILQEIENEKVKRARAESAKDAFTPRR